MLFNDEYNFFLNKATFYKYKPSPQKTAEKEKYPPVVSPRCFQLPQERTAKSHLTHVAEFKSRNVMDRRAR